MNPYCVIDTSAFIWNRQLFDQNAAPFYDLASDLVVFFAILEKERPKILMRGEMIAELFNGFPYDLMQAVPNFRELSSEVYKFFGSYTEIEQFPADKLDEIESAPDIVYPHYADAVKEETIILISKIHADDRSSTYFTFRSIWVNDEQLRTIHENERTHETVVSDQHRLDAFFDQFKLKFEHNHKHDKLLGWRKGPKGEDIAPLSCDNGQVTNPYAQHLLDIAQVSDNGKRYSYDHENDVFIRFHGHARNRLHAFDEKNEDVPRDIIEHFTKK